MQLKNPLKYEKYNRVNPIDDSKYSFYPYYNIKTSDDLSCMSKYSILLLFSSGSKNFDDMKLRKGHEKEKKTTVYDNTSELCNDHWWVYFNQYMNLPDYEKRQCGDKYNPINLFLDVKWYENEEFAVARRKSDEEESDMPPLEGWRRI